MYYFSPSISTTFRQNHTLASLCCDFAASCKRGISLFNYVLTYPRPTIQLPYVSLIYKLEQYSICIIPWICVMVINLIREVNKFIIIP